MNSASNFHSDGLYLADDFLSADACRAILASIAEFRSQNPAMEVFRNYRGRPLNYSVIDGLQILRELPSIVELQPRINAIVDDLANEPLEPLQNERVAINVNITGKGATYRWHYDRNRVTALLYLNTVEGGETECYPNYRIDIRDTFASRFQQPVDRLLQRGLVRNILGNKFVCPPREGRLLIMRGDRCLHSVGPVMSDEERINIVLSYDRPNAELAANDQLDSYLYDPKTTNRRDPNYRS